MAKTYYYCDGGVCGSRQVTLTDVTGCYLDSSSGTQGTGDYVEIWKQRIRFSLDSALPAGVDLTVYYTLYQTTDTTWNGGSNHYEMLMPHSAVIFGGTSYTDVTFECYVIQEADMSPAGGIEVYTETNDSETLSTQPVFPDCCLEPTGTTCVLAITGYTVTNCAIRGDSTGSIEVCVSGNSGNAELYVNGEVYVSGYDGACQTVTGLTAGDYTIAIRDSSLCVAQDTYTVLDGEFRTKDFNVIEPKSLTATENPIILSLGTGVNSASPAYGKSTFEVTGTINDGDSITITLEYPQSYTAVFTAKYFPNRDDYFLASTLKNSVGASVGTNTTSEIAKSIEECFQKDVILSRLYDFRASGNYVYATSREYNDKLNLTTGSTVTTTGNITCTETVVGVTQYDGQLSQNYSLYCDILVNESVEYGDVASIDTFNKVASIELPFNSSNLHFFDVAPILKNFVTTKKIDFTFTGHTTFSKMICSYYLEYGEKYPLIQNETTKKSRVKGTSSQLFCINSSLDWTEVNDMSAYVGSASTSPSGYTTGVKFLTDAPYTKYVNRDSSEFSFFIVPADYGKTLTVVGDLYFYDGSVVTGETLITISGITFGGVYGVATGYRELKLNTYEVLTGGTTRKVRRVDFAVYQSDSANTLTYTETRSYRYEIDEMPRRYGVSFLNSKGTWDIFDFSGEIVNDIDFTNERMEVPRDVNAGGNSPMGFQSNKVYDTKVTRKIAANSGWIDEEHFNWLIQLLSSNVIYSYTEDEQPFLLVDSVNYQKSSNDDLYNIDVTFIETLHINNISV